MRLVLASCFVFVACGYSPPRSASDDDATAGDDSAIDAPVSCTPGAPACSGAQLGTCNATGDGVDTAGATECTLACVESPQPHCASASNIPEPTQASCIGSNPPDLIITSGTVTVTATGAITCNPTCGTIAPFATLTQSSGPTVVVQCLGTVSLPAGTTLRALATFKAALAIFATGTVTIDGEILFGGSDAVISAGGGGGPGGTDGAEEGENNGNGVTVPGTCGGAGGIAGPLTGMPLASRDGSGGGGGGHGGAGGSGGDGRTDLDVTVVGAPASMGGCGVEALAPLTGGAGGGSGGDGECGGTSKCGLPGGGGGGAIQIASRGAMSIVGAVLARGGSGFGNGTSLTLLHGGAGGGGAGGGILLESHRIVFGTAAALDVNGGSGGDSGAGLGGTTGSGGTDATVTNTGGAGGGGGAGLIRVNAPGNACAQAVPAGACSTGVPPAS